MANTLTPTDVYAIINDVAYQATGRQDLTAVDSSTFVTVGETLLRTSAENTLNALSTVLARTIFSVRPYKAKFESIRATNERWGAMVRKVVILPGDAEASEDWNTDLSSTQLDDDNSVDMYTIKKPQALQLNFYGTKVLQKHITRFRDQLAMAFQSESEFAMFIDAVMTEFANDVETMNEAESRLTVLNFMAGLSSMATDNCVVDLTEEFNDEKGTTYTRDEILSSHMDDFLKFFVGRIKTDSNRLTDRTSLYHANITGKTILRHTPKDRQKMLMYAPLFIKAEAEVYSSIFNPEYLKIGDFESVNYWQAQSDPSAISITPNILDVSTGESTTADSAVALDYVVGLLYDDEALGINFQFDYASTTPFNSAGGYYNMYMHWRRNFWNDFTENGILYIMGAGGE